MTDEEFDFLRRQEAVNSAVLRLLLRIRDPEFRILQEDIEVLQGKISRSLSKGELEVDYR